MSRSSVQHLLKHWHIIPNTNQGQHFLVDDTILERIVAAADVSQQDAVLEIGPGIGTLTALLAGRAGRVVAVEIDPQFKPLLDALTAVNANTRIIFSDILKLPFERIRDALAVTADEPYTIVANIPYYLTSRFFATVLKYPHLPRMIVVLIQKEVAERIMAGTGDHSKLSLSIQLYATPRIAFQVPHGAFNPIPEVDSAVLVLEHIHPWSFPISERRVWQLISFGFSSKRKKLVNNLMAGLQQSREETLRLLERARIDPAIRAEDMRLDAWIELAKELDRNKE